MSLSSRRRPHTLPQTHKVVTKLWAIVSSRLQRHPGGINAICSAPSTPTLAQGRPKNVRWARSPGAISEGEYRKSHLTDASTWHDERSTVHVTYCTCRQTASETRLPCRFRPVVVHTPCHKRIKLLQSCGRSLFLTLPLPQCSTQRCNQWVQCRAARPLPRPARPHPPSVRVLVIRYENAR